MKNKVALVTGGMGGIGTAICRQLAQQGATVIATYNRGGNHEAANRWREEQHLLGFDIATYYVDVTNFKSCEQMIHDLQSQFQHLDI